MLEGPYIRRCVKGLGASLTTGLTLEGPRCTEMSLHATLNSGTLPRLKAVLTRLSSILQNLNSYSPASCHGRRKNSSSDRYDLLCPFFRRWRSGSPRTGPAIPAGWPRCSEALGQTAARGLFGRSGFRRYVKTEREMIL